MSIACAGFAAGAGYHSSPWRRSTRPTGPRRSSPTRPHPRPVKPHQPTRLDVSTFARTGSVLEGTLPLSDLPRLLASTSPPADTPPGEATWRAQGLWRQPLGDQPQLRLQLQAHARVWLTCQRCLQPAAHELAVARTLRFVPTEEEAARLDEAEEEEDVLALPRVLNLHELIEDELILALPLVPRHEQCPEPLPWEPEMPTTPAEVPGEEVAHPFAALARLKQG